MKFWQTESFWLTVGAAAAAVLSSAGLGSLGTDVKAVIDAGAALIAAAYVHGVASAKVSTTVDKTPAAVASVLRDAESGLRAGK